MAYERLFSEGKIGTMTLKNRVVMTGIGVMTGDPGGFSGERDRAYFGERARGGVGLLITAVTRVNDSDGAVAPTQLSMANDRYIPSLTKLVDEVHAAGSKMVVQLHHPGRQNFCAYANMAPLIEGLGRLVPSSWEKSLKMLGSTSTEDMCRPPMTTLAKYFMKYNLAPSAVPLYLGDTAIKGQPVRAMTVKDIRRVERQFAEAAERVKRAGADGVELHAAHGYLISEFFSPYTNRRTDEYGGSLENRTRFLKEIIEQVRDKVGQDFPLLVRLNVDEFYRDIDIPGMGLELKEGVEIAKLAEKYGADAIDVSCGTYETLNHLMEPTTYPLGWRTYLAKAVREAVSIPVISVGMIRTPEQAEELLENGSMDFIGLARPLVADPLWVKKAAEGRSEDIIRCIACQTCKMQQMKNTPSGETARCALNPRACHEYEYPLAGRKDGAGRAVVVVGAGPGGMTAARELALRGFDVTVLEKTGTTGGQLNLADKPPHKEKYEWPTHDLYRAAVQAGAKFVFNTEATPEIIGSYRPYAVFITTGAASVRPRIPGADGANVCTITEVLNGKTTIKDEDVLLIGSGLSGLETAHLLAENGCRVKVIEMASQLAPGAWFQNVRDVVPKLEKAGTKFYTSRKLLEIRPDGIIVENLDSGEEEFYTGGRVVLSLGVKPVGDLQNRLRDKYERLYVAGDAVKGGYIIDSTLPAFEYARRLH